MPPGIRIDSGVRVPVRCGRSYRVVSPPNGASVTPELARELTRVLERFAMDAGFGPARRVTIEFRPGIVGHHQVGRAADIYSVGNIGLDRWKKAWDLAMTRAAKATTEQLRCACIDGARRSNLGWRLYKALQVHGRWSQPYGYPIQLFGPWTRTEGPWKHISDGLLRAHRDHIHVAW